MPGTTSFTEIDVEDWLAEAYETRPYPQYDLLSYWTVPVRELRRKEAPPRGADPDWGVAHFAPTSKTLERLRQHIELLAKAYTWNPDWTDRDSR